MNYNVDEQEFIPESGVSVEITYMEPLAEHADTEVSAVHFADETAEAEVLEANTAEIQDDGNATIEFTAESFSVYGVIYTVDFHWELNGKTYDFSIPGGGFVSFYDLVGILGIEADDPDTEKDEIQELVDAVERIEFSNPELVSISKVEEDTTVGAIKERLQLVCRYSAELTEEEIDEINAQEALAGDWALISLLPFDSNETITVTMKNGDIWTVQVTDYARQVSPNIVDALDGKTYALVGDDNALLTAESFYGGNRLRAVRYPNLNNLNSDAAQWKFERDKDTGKFKISSNGQYLHISHSNINDATGSLSVSSTPQQLNVTLSGGQIRITDDYGYAVNLFGRSVYNGYGAWRHVRPRKDSYVVGSDSSAWAAFSLM